MQYQYIHTANTTVSTIIFEFMGDSSGKCVWFLDDASAIDIIALGVELLQNPSFNNSKTALTV
jgi:hypothetical protein